MAAINTDVTTMFESLRKDGDLISYKVNGGATVGNVCAGCLAAIDTAGYLLTSGVDTASFLFAGVTNEGDDNTAGSDGDDEVEVWRKGTFVFDFTQGGVNLGTATQAMIGKEVYLKNNRTVTDTTGSTTASIKCGKIVQILNGGLQVRIDITGYAI